MGKIKTAGLLAALAAGVLLLNGWINYRLFQPLPGAAPVINTLRRHLDDGAFALLFLTAGLVFVGMAAAMRERGYGQLGLFALFASAQLFAEWDEGRLLFGELPEVPYGSLAIKCGTAFLAFSFVRRLLTDQESQGSRAVSAAAGLLWAAIAAATAFGAAEPVFAWLNALFLLLVFTNIALTAPRFLVRLRREPETQELRWLAWGSCCFSFCCFRTSARTGWRRCWAGRSGTCRCSGSKRLRIPSRGRCSSCWPCTGFCSCGASSGRWRPTGRPSAGWSFRTRP
ncbi:hypothetical protein N6H14_15605 [Paenibacillus sp. CC-CFT747]|nr:hypothetical protein N6H14_15605 [Paenibacillus sp. CC-CFT747]